MIGFALYWAWVDGALFTPVLYHPYSASAALSVIHLYVIAVSLLLLVLLVLIRRFSIKLDGVKTLVGFSVSSTLGSILLAIAGYSQNLLVLVCAVAALGIGMALQGLAWGVLATSLDGREANMCIPGVVGFSAVFGITIMGMTSAMGMIFIIALPLLSLLFYILYKRDKERVAALVENSEGTSGPTQKSGPGKQEESSTLDMLPFVDISAESTLFTVSFFRKMPARFFVLLLIFCTAFGIMQYLLVIPSIRVSEISRFNIGMRGLVAAIFFVGMGVFSWKPTVTYKVGFLLVIAGFLAVPFIKDEAISSAFIMMGYTCYDMMAWIVVCALGNLWKSEVQRTVSLARAVSLAGVLIGGLIGIVLTQVIALERVDEAIITTAIAYLLVMATILSFDRGPSGFWSLIGRNRFPEDEAPHSVLLKVIDEIAEQFGLTPREREFFSYLAQGRSIPWVVNRLSISDGTGRSHTRNIYSKLGVHSRQQLLDMIDSRVSTFPNG
jgi:DNA-binding CsgD family transcriptional regulator/MFS family permease